MATHKTDLGTKWDVGVAINRTNPIPLDSTQNHSSLDTLQTYATSGASSYVGQQVNVIDSNGNLKGAYIIKNKQGELMELASSSSVESLSGVFTFKGVAEAVSPDLSYIVTCQEYEGDALSPIGTAADLEGDIYYGWQIGSNTIWTDSLVLNSASIQYNRGAETTVRCVFYNDEYYFTTETVDDSKTVLESISGHQIKVYTSDLQAQVHDRIYVYDGEIIGDGYIIEYTAYRFTPKANNDTVDVSHAHTIIYASDGTKVVDDTTIPNNSGHVYQIGENEYASNGQIWVKLGSPVEDWIIL